MTTNLQALTNKLTVAYCLTGESQPEIWAELEKVLDNWIASYQPTSVKSGQEMQVAEKDAAKWRDDDSPQSETTFGVRKEWWKHPEIMRAVAAVCLK